MLAKLIKYDLKYIYKSLVVLALLLFVCIIGFNLTDYRPEYIIDEQTHTVVKEILPPDIILALHGFFGLAFPCIIIVLTFMTILTLWRRFKSNLYSDEAYLTHTLPISHSLLWASKVLSAFIVIIGLILTLALGATILALTHGGQAFLEDFGLISGNIHGVGVYYSVEVLPFTYYLTFALAVFTQLIFVVLCGYIGNIIGHLANNRQGFHTILVGFSFYLLGGIILLLLFCYTGILSFDLQITNDDTLNFESTTYLVISGIYIAYSVTLYIAGQKLLQKGVNLE